MVLRDVIDAPLLPAPELEAMPSEKPPCDVLHAEKVTSGTRLKPRKSLQDPIISWGSNGKIRSSVMMQVQRGAGRPAFSRVSVLMSFQSGASVSVSLSPLHNQELDPLLLLATSGLDPSNAWRLCRDRAVGFTQPTPTHTPGKVDAAAHAYFCC